jgi:MFS family permease
VRSSWLVTLVTDRRRRRPALTSLLFGMTLRMAGVVLPVYMAHEGVPISTIGLVVAASGITQLAVRPWLAHLLRRFPDRSVIVVAILLVSVSGFAVLIGPYLWVFIASQLLQGAARALYWTASQTYVVRGKDRSASSLAEVNFASSVGQLIGPAVAGFVLGQSVTGAVVALGVVPLVSLATALRLDRHEPFPPKVRTPGAGSWRNGMVRSGAWGGVSAGAFEGLVSSYVPVLLLHHDFSAGTIGVVLSVSNVGGVLGGLTASRFPSRRARTALWSSALFTGGGLMATATWPDSVVAVTVGLTVGGFAAGVLRTLGPAAAADAVPEGNKGDALTMTGTFRALSLIASPAIVGGLVLAAPLTVSMLAAAGVVAATGVPTWWFARSATPVDRTGAEVDDVVGDHPRA